jgi:hypothetical protein
MRYVVARMDGSVDVVERTAPLALKELQEMVGGDIEAVSISGVKMTRNGRRVDAMVNKEGRLMGLPENPFFAGLRGNVVLGKPEDSEFVGLNASETRDARHWLSRALA